MTTLEDSLDSVPASNLALERLFLGGLLLANRKERNEATKWLTKDAFHDPLHQWFFVAFRSARNCDSVGEVLRHLSAEARESPPKLETPLTQAMVAELIYRRDGVPLGAEVRHLKRNAAELLRLSVLRKKQVELETQLIAVLQEARDGNDETNV